jgi:hypothetical protein
MRTKTSLLQNNINNAERRLVRKFLGNTSFKIYVARSSATEYEIIINNAYY